MSTDLAPVPAPRYLAIYIGAPNDTNGNPRRGWYVHDLTDPSAPVTWIEEGYGNFPWPTFAARLGLGECSYYDDRLRALVRQTGRIDVTPSEYRAASKLPRFGTTRSVGGAK